MIFSGDLCDKVLAGTKTQTRRPVKYGPDDAALPCRYEVGKTYAIQRKRGTFGLGPRLLVLDVKGQVARFISPEDALAEGFESQAEFIAKWDEFYGREAILCWAITFVVGVEEAA